MEEESVDIWKCNFCSKELELKHGKYTKSGHLAGCVEWKRVKKEVLTAEFLEKNYNELGKSAKEIANDVGLSSAIAIIKLLREFGIRTRSVKESTNFERVKERRIKTNIERTGFEHNFCGDHPSRLEWEKRLFDEEGITNVFQREEVKEQSRKTCVEKYGYPSAMQSPEVAERVWESTLMNNGVRYGVLLARTRVTKIHKQIVEVLHDIGVYCDIEVVVGDRFCVDIVICGTNKVVEVYGDFWHANPIKYMEDDVLPFPHGEKKVAKDIWEKDKNRLNYIRSCGYEVLIIWENDIYKNIDTVKEQLWEFVK